MLRKFSFSVKSFCPLVAVLLVACGGGDDNNAGAPVALNATPSSFSFDNPVVLDPNNSDDSIGNYPCGAGQQLIFVNGGAGPYTIQSTSPGVVVDKTQINKGEGFEATVSGSCMEDVQILIKDKNNNQITVGVTTTRTAVE